MTFLFENKFNKIDELSMAIVGAAIGSWAFFDFHPNRLFLAGTAIVFVSIYLYNAKQIGGSRSQWKRGRNCPAENGARNLSARSERKAHDSDDDDESDDNLSSVAVQFFDDEPLLQASERKQKLPTEMSDQSENNARQRENSETAHNDGDRSRNGSEERALKIGSNKCVEERGNA